MFCGFKSRWMTPREWANAKASQTFWKTVSRALSGYLASVSLSPAFSFADHVVQRDAHHELHGVEEPALLIRAHVMDGDDVGMRKLAEDAGFLKKALLLLLGSVAPEHDLHGHAATELVVPCVEHRTHAATGNLAAGAVGGAGCHALGGG